MITDEEWEGLFNSFYLPDVEVRKAFKNFFSSIGIHDAGVAKDFLQILDRERCRKTPDWFFARLHRVIVDIQADSVLKERARKNE